MTYLVTGGSGFLGINLIRDLLDRVQRVVSLDIAPLDYPDVADRVRAIRGDIRDVQAVRAALEGVNIVVHAAAALPLYDPADTFSTEVDGTRVVLEEALRNGAERVIHISSTAVYGISDHPPLLETVPLQGVGPYEEAKVLAEQVCEEYRRKGMCLPILRTKSFIGPERLGGLRFCTNGPGMASIFPSWGGTTTRTNSWTWRTCARPSGSAPPCHLR